MDESSPGANPLAEGWAAMGAIYREAWERALRAPADRGAASAVLGDALERMRRLTEAAEAQVFGPANAASPVASKADYASVGERIEGVLERLSRLDAAMSAAAAAVEAGAPEDTRSGPKPPSKTKTKDNQKKTKQRG